MSRLSLAAACLALACHASPTEGDAPEPAPPPVEDEQVGEDEPAARTPRADFEAARARWLASDARRAGYSIELTWGAFSPVSGTHRLAVSAGGDVSLIESTSPVFTEMAAQAAEDDAAGFAVQLMQGMTVDGLLDSIGELLDRADAAPDEERRPVLEVAYDAVDGHPLNLSADPIPRAMDDEWSVTVLSVEAAGG